ncbi:MAG: hypothetical protein U1E20_06190 [Methylocystis sp.]|uniref:hypothetical protein n=1 Tax=Methylocystis sp. TaxID=1911079 RepID=UPI00392CA0ED
MYPANQTDDDRFSLVIQREVGMALRLSFEAVTREPLPERMVLLLLQLALAESLGLAAAEDGAEGEAGRNED